MLGYILRRLAIAVFMGGTSILSDMATEPWLRGPIAGVHPLVMPVLLRVFTLLEPARAQPA